MTQFFPCKQGVRQGDPLSPILFNIFLNGIFHDLKNGNCDPVTLDDESFINALAYADDLVIMSTSKEGLQKALDILHKYCDQWKLKINSTKTKCVSFTRGTQKEKHVFTINGQNLENAKEVKYLGIYFHKKNCSFTPTIKNLKIKATRALYGIKAKIKLNRLPVLISLKLFDCLIKPILLYASEVWEPFLNQDSNKWDYGEIEKTHLQFLKQILGVNRSTTNILVRGELDRHSLQEEILRRNINYAKYINQKDNTHLVKQAYNFERTRPGEKISLFNTMQKYTLRLHELHKCFLPWHDPLENIYNIPVNKMKTYTYQIFHSEWKNNLLASTKGSTYRLFKQDMKLEGYLSYLRRNDRTILTKFRVSDHKLMIEVGRHKRPPIPRANRTCFWCHNEIEDEQHFLIACQLYGSRNRWLCDLLGKYPTLTSLTDNDKYIYLMSQEDPDITKSLATKIGDWNNLRNLLKDHFFQP